MPVSSNLITTGVGLTYGTSVAFALLSMSVCIAALTLDQWFHYSASSSNTLDLWGTCLGSNCTDYAYVDTNRAACTLAGTELQGRIFTLRGLMIAAPVLLFMYCALLGVGLCCDSVGTMSAAVVCSMLAVFCIAAEIGLFYQTTTSWFFCGMDPCDYYRALGSTSPCYYMFGGPFALVWTAGASAVATTVLGGIALQRMRAPSRIPKLRGKDGKTGTARRRVGGVSSTAGAAGRQMASTASAVPAPPTSAPGTARNGSVARAPSVSAAVGGGAVRAAVVQPPLEGWRMGCEDFTFDEETGYYYSEHGQLYYDADGSGMFFDPQRHAQNRLAWFDPETNAWG
jgi:hypothetical protein